MFIIKTKTIKINPMISDHDLSTKLRQIKKLISKKNSITLIMSIKGRLIINKESFQKKFNQIIKKIELENSIKVKNIKKKNNIFSANF